MKSGAVIVAAGMSTRMQQFKQMMKIGNLTMAERVIVNFQCAGIKEIVVVTGYQAEGLEQKLEHLEVTFLRNKDYETTQMLDSAKIGLSYLMNRCKKILFCPVDIPLFMPETVKQLLKQEGKLVMPVYGKESGHPILLHHSLIPDIMRYEGERGLRGALDSLEVEPVLWTVADEGTVADADTREDFENLIHIHNARLVG